MALLKVKGNIERLFDKNLNDLVRGIRNHKEDEAKYIASCLEEIKQELRQHNLAVKTNAVASFYAPIDAQCYERNIRLGP